MSNQQKTSIEQALEQVTPSRRRFLQQLLGGSADLTGSNLTNTSSTPALRFDQAGQVSRTPAARAGVTSTTACANSAWPPS